MFSKIKLLKNNSGQAMVLFALVFVALCGFAAIAIDVGSVAVEKTDLQDAADAAALGGAQDLPSAANAKSAAVYYAGQNGVQASETAATSPYNGDSKKIEVVCTRTVEYTFARVLGFTSIDLSARAVAEYNSQWAGEALPFINLDDNYETNSEIVAWEKTGPGDFESIDNYEIINSDDPDKCYFKVDYMHGIEIKKGTVATIKQEVGYVYDQHYPDKPVYVLSLSTDVMNSDKVKLIDGSYRSLSKLKNNDVIDPSQLMLLKCIFHDYDYKGKTLYFTVLDEYDIANNEFPPDYVNPEGGDVKLVD